MDQEFVNNKTTKDLAQNNPIPAVELPSLNIINKLSLEDIKYLENEVLPFSILKNLHSKFEDFSEEWGEVHEGINKKQFSKSSKTVFRYFHLHNPHLNFKNKLITNTYSSKDNYQIKVNESRTEIILTDGEVTKGDKKEINSTDNLFVETHQDIVIFNASYLVILDREKKTNPYGRWEHHDEIHFYMADRIKLDYLRLYIGSNF